MWDLLPLLWGFDVSEKLTIASFAEEVAGVEAAFAPGFFGRLGELPVIEAGAKTESDGLWTLCPLVVSEAMVVQAQGFGKHPSFTVVLV